MKTNEISIKVYQGKQIQASFYVLSRGNHSGKILSAPCPNCYAITAPPELAQLVQATAQILYLSGKLTPLLRGSVIEFVSIASYKKAFFHLWQTINLEKLQKATATLSALQQYLESIQSQQITVRQLIKTTALAALK